jgi:hypothetical protein
LDEDDERPAVRLKGRKSMPSTIGGQDIKKSGREATGNPDMWICDGDRRRISEPSPVLDVAPFVADFSHGYLQETFLSASTNRPAEND